MPHMKTIDSHVHIYTTQALRKVRDYRLAAGLDALCLASIGCIGEARAAQQNLLSLLIKREERGIFAYGSLLYPSLPAPEKPEGRFDPLRQAQDLIRLGFDGVKLLESKPGCRKKIGRPLNGPLYRDFFAYLEETGTPILWHVADPETFWDASRAPKFALDAGWVYTDGTYPSKEALYEEVRAVLDRHPKLQVTLAHFYFLSAFEEEARALLERHPNVWLDLTPGIEMYENFSLAPARWRDFFSEYRERIVLGTDYADDDTAVDPADTVRHIVRFLSTEDHFPFWGRLVNGLGLAEEAVRDIVGGNFTRRNGKRPRDVDREAMADYFDKWLDCVADADMRTYLIEYL